MHHVGGSTEHKSYQQVSRAFRDAIVASPLVQHKIKLFTARFQYNVATPVGLADSKRALLQHRANWDSLLPVEERTVDDLQRGSEYSPGSAGGVYAMMKDPVRLFSPGSTSRGIPYKEWRIPLPIADPSGYGFCPSTDVVAFVEVKEHVCVHPL